MSGRPAKLGWAGFLCVCALTACNDATSPGLHPLVGKWDITEAKLDLVSRTFPASLAIPDVSSSTTQDETGKGFYLLFKANDTVLAAFPNVGGLGKRSFKSPAADVEISGKWSVSGDKLMLILQVPDVRVADTSVYVMDLAGTNLDLVQTITSETTADDTTHTNIQVRSFRATKAD